MSSPKVSFVIPSHNCVAWLAHAIESAQKQSYANLEIVVVDDASTDTTPILMRHFASDKRVVYRRLDVNRGRSEARNIGNQMATGEYICVLDADDIAYPDRARLTAEKLKNCGLVHGSCDFIDELGNKIGTHVSDVFRLDKALREGVNRMVHSTLGYRKDVALKFPYHSGRISEIGLDDWAFQLEVASAGVPIDNILPAVGAYRNLASGISRTRKEDEVREVKGKFLESLKVSA